MQVLQKFLEKFGITVVGYTDLVSRMGQQSSELYAATVTTLRTASAVRAVRPDIFRNLIFAEWS